jgi:hypothetical protein
LLPPFEFEPPLLAPALPALPAPPEFDPPAPAMPEVPLLPPLGPAVPLMLPLAPALETAPLPALELELELPPAELPARLEFPALFVLPAPEFMAPSVELLEQARPKRPSAVSVPSVHAVRLRVRAIEKNRVLRGLSLPQCPRWTTSLRHEPVTFRVAASNAEKSQ